MKMAIRANTADTAKLYRITPVIEAKQAPRSVPIAWPPNINAECNPIENPLCSSSVFSETITGATTKKVAYVGILYNEKTIRGSLLNKNVRNGNKKYMHKPMFIICLLGNPLASNLPTKYVATIPIIVAVELIIAIQFTFCPNSFSMKMANNPTYKELVV